MKKKQRSYELKYILDLMKNDVYSTDPRGEVDEGLLDDLDFLLSDPDEMGEGSTGEVEESEEESEKGSEDTTPLKEEEEEHKPEPEQEDEREVEDVHNQEDAEARKQAWLDTVLKDFAISEEDTNLIINEPEVVLSKLAT